MNDPLQPNRCAELLSALAAPERLKIVRFLSRGRRNVGEVAAMLATTPVNTSHHLMVLRNAGLIRAEKQGRFVYYSLRPEILQQDEADGNCLNLGCCRLELPRQPEPPPSEGS